MKGPIQKLNSLGQSVWYDNISRQLLENGELQAMIKDGVIRGVTSNPSIFHNAIANSKAYDSALVTMAWAGYSADEIFDRLIYEDIQAAADLLLPLYHSTQGGDGYVSLEVSPKLAHNSVETLKEAHRLWTLVDRPNLMIKIPGTHEGLSAIQKATAAGININITLIFSLRRYQEVMEAYLSGLEDRIQAQNPVDKIASVASFFVSRMDTKVDKLLEKVIMAEGVGAETAQALLGKAAIANARLAYQLFQNVFKGDRFARLKAHGARLQRPLWASTSTKNPVYSDTMYVDSLIGIETINTMPPQTIVAFQQHGITRLTIEEGVDEAHQVLEKLEDLGISVDLVTIELEQEGVKAFADAFDGLMFTIEKRRSEAQRELGHLAESVTRRVKAFEEQHISARIYAIDPSVWTADPAGQDEIKKRLGWLDLPENSRHLIPELESLKAEVKDSGFTHVILLGMGGSSLAPEVLRSVYGPPEAGLELSILDSTDPTQVQATAKLSPVEKTLYIVSSKSGGTAEINAFLDYFWTRTKKSQGTRTGKHFIAITDPGTSLEKLAKERGFRRIFLADALVGGRFSALTAFGLVPAALMGLNVEKILDKAAWMSRQCKADVPAGRNPGLVLGAIVGESTLHGKDKLTLVADDLHESFGAWLEQLVAESSGKQGKGIVPIEGEPLARHGLYGKDRLFVYLRSEGTHNGLMDRLRKKGHPALTLDVQEKDDLASEFFRWELATAAACAILGVNAFDQPDVQDSKTRTINKIKVYQKEGKFDEGKPVWEKEGVKLYGPEFLAKAKSLEEAIEAFLRIAHQGDYVALNAYLPRNPKTKRLMGKLRVAVQSDTGLATTVGFGPRFLHSTGQLHKGGPDSGVFIQITAEPDHDLPIPNQGMTFGTLERAQALGDLEALQSRGRRVLRLHLSHLKDLEKLIQKLA